MSDLRPCVVVCQESRTGKDENFSQNVEVDKEAVFHRFGDAYRYADERPFPFTVAIVEMKATGQVVSVSPERVRFTEA